LITDFVFNAHFIDCLAFKVKPKQAVMQAWKARKSVSLLSAQPTEILGTKLKLPRQRALGLEFGRILGGSNLALAGYIDVIKARKNDARKVDSQMPGKKV
jgi:hypothetical protein